MAGEAEPEPLAYLRGAEVLYELEDAETTIGRSEDNDIVLDGSKSVSSSHARIVIRNALSKVAEIEDLQSMNGTFLNGVRISGATKPLQSGDNLRFGYDQSSYR